MKELLNVVKKYILWVLISYIFAITLFIVFLFIPQRNIIIKYKTEKNLLEYNYLKIKNEPSFLNSINKTIKMAEDKINCFEWLNFSSDPNLAFFQYISEIISKKGIEIVSIKKLENPTDLYYFWELKLIGSFGDFFHFIHNVETGKKYLKIEEISISEEKDGKNSFNIIVSGIKKR